MVNGLTYSYQVRNFSATVKQNIRTILQRSCLTNFASHKVRPIKRVKKFCLYRDVTPRHVSSAAISILLVD